MRFFFDIGAMDRLITIRNTSSPTKNDWGEVTSSTNTDVTVNAAYSYESKDEKNEIKKESQFNYLYFIIRYGITVTLESKVIYESEEYDVINIEPIQRQRFLKLKVKRFE